MPAGRAAVGREMQPAPHARKGSFVHVMPGDLLEIEVAAAPAVRVAGERHRRGPTVEARFARPAAPRAQPGQAEQMVFQAAAL